MVTALAQVVPLAFASGVNLYATVAVLGLSSHYGLVRLPEQFRAFDHPANGGEQGAELLARQR